MSVIPSATPVRLGLEGSRHESFKVTQRDCSTVARDDDCYRFLYCRINLKKRSVSRTGLMLLTSSE